MTDLLPDARTQTEVRCRVCGKWISISRSRLFFVGEGTVRTCKKGLEPHKAFTRCPGYAKDPTIQHMTDCRTCLPDSTDAKHLCNDRGWVDDSDVATELNEHGEKRCTNCGERILLTAAEQAAEDHAVDHGISYRESM